MKGFRQAAIWKKFNPVSDERWLSHLLLVYLDQNEKARFHGRSAPTPADFEDGVFAFGFVRGRAFLRRPWSNNTQAKASITDWWINDVSELGEKAHHITASFHPELTKTFQERNFPVDSLLLSTAHNTLSQFSSRFYPGQSLGWVASVHHDSSGKVPHLHLLLHPRTSSGTKIRLSGKKAGELGEDHFNFIRETFVSHAMTLSREANLAPSFHCRESDVAHWLNGSYVAHKTWHKTNSKEPDGDHSSEADYLSQFFSKDGLSSRLASATKTVESEFYLRGGVPDPNKVTEIKSSITAAREHWDERVELESERRNKLRRFIETRSIPLSHADEDRMTETYQKLTGDTDLNRKLVSSFIANQRDEIRDFAGTTSVAHAVAAYRIVQYTLASETGQNQPPFFLKHGEPNHNTVRGIKSLDDSLRQTESLVDVLVKSEAAAHSPEVQVATPPLLSKTIRVCFFPDKPLPPSHTIEMDFGR